MTVNQENVNAVVTAADSRYVRQVAGKDLSTNDFTDAEKTKLAGLYNTTVDSSLSDSSENPVQNKKVKEALDTKANASDLATVATSGSYTDLSNTPSLSDLGGVVTVAKQTNAESGYAATYVVKQNGSQVGEKINIPKDFLVKSASVETVETADSPVSGYSVGDKYLDFVINTKDNSSTDEHLYVLVSDLIDTYTADNSTLQLSNNQFSIKDNGVTLGKLSTGVQTSLGYADSWNSSPAKGITSNDISNWNAKSELTTSDVDTEIEAYFSALTTALSQ